jgi:hypothetical protein
MEDKKITKGLTPLEISFSSSGVGNKENINKRNRKGKWVKPFP